MAAFVYRAVDALGQTQRGVVEASSATGARRLLRDRSLLPVSVEATRAAVTTPRPALFGPKIGAKALSTLTRQLATLVGTDIRVEEALRLVAAQAAATPVAELLLNVRGRILDGGSFATALAEHPAVFPEFFRASVAAGEQSGKLPQVLAHLADFVDSRYRAANKLQLALLYPALLGVVSFGMMTLLLIYVVPDITRVFISRGAELPFLTRALIAISWAVSHFGLVALVIIAGAIIATRRWLAVPANRLRFHQFIATTRPFSGFSRQLNAARFAGSLATLVQSDVPLVDAIATAAAVTPNMFVRKQALEVATRVREGTSLHRAMDEARVFPPMLVAIVASGESSGRLGPVLARAGVDLDRDLDSLVATLMGLIEPAVLLTMGGVVLLMVLSILLPIINLNNLAGQ
ncbi:type II secretion system F family protein [Glacieibacterium megasporae]|uniref:type II secretion system F family protein n=1 Tax=Glacieibacterium megasporae TaxID=2835787 RepID=UPI001C1E398B|nr:type II secretion system F family protein [Polymorphobacter megasporae]UAJ10266.1 type II secretion system F family protein [Polymorphobacter megasporae]